MTLEKEFPPRRPSPTRSVGTGPRRSVTSSQAKVITDIETFLSGGGCSVTAGTRTPTTQQQRSPNHSVRRKPRSSPHRYHGSHSNGCASASASPQKDASCVSRSQSMRTARRPQSLDHRFRQRIASIPGDMLMVNQDIPLGCNDSQGSSNNSLPSDEGGDVLRLRNFAVTSKGVVNRGDSFRSKSRSTHSVASNGSGNKLIVPASQDEAESPVEKTYACATLDDAGHVVSSVQHLGAAVGDTVRPDGACPEEAIPLTASLPPEVVVTRTGDTELARYRVLVLGSMEVGKTSLTRQFMTSEYICAYDSSLDEENEKTVMVVLNGEESELVFIEHPSVEDLKNPVSTYNPDAYLVVYNVASRSSWQAAKEYLSIIHRWDNAEHKAIILVGNKTDLVRLRTVSTEDGRSLATHEAVKFIETSAGINHHVDELLAGLLHQIRLKHLHIEKERKRRDSVKIRGRNTTCASSFSGCKAKVILKRFLRKACSRSRSCDDLHVL